MSSLSQQYPAGMALLESLFESAFYPNRIRNQRVVLYRRIFHMSKRLFVISMASILTACVTMAQTTAEPARKTADAPAAKVAESPVPKPKSVTKAETAAASANAEKAPRLTIVEPVKDYGTVPKGDKLDWAFEIKNTGDSD